MMYNARKNISTYLLLVVLFAIIVSNTISFAQNKSINWHGIERNIHYKPKGNDFILVNGNKKFNRALYGSNTAFRVEAGDLPEFAMYMPGMGGNTKIGIIVNGKSKWLTETTQIETIYRPGCMMYQIKDASLKNGVLNVTVIPEANKDGMLVQLSTQNIPINTQLVIVYGGASGKKFSRDGDIGADPESSFYLQTDYCKDNIYQIQANCFKLQYGFTKPLTDDERYEIQYKSNTTINLKSTGKHLQGIFPPQAKLTIADAANQQSSLQLLQSASNNPQPLITATIHLNSTDTLYYGIHAANNANDSLADYSTLANAFIEAEKVRSTIANRIIVETPDETINPIGGALAIAADAIWEEPSYLHGAIAWRMRLPAWRGAYAADPLGWHERARMHFDSYALSQVTNIPFTKPVFDSVLHNTRQLEKMGTAMFSNGYICRNPNGDIRPHHYDMNLVFVDQLINHFNYTGDTAYVKKMWKLLELHAEWEKKNFDADGDGLYDAYAAIWASDALQYSGGGVTHSSAYNFRANKTMAELAKLIGKNGNQYQQEASKIQQAMNQHLWLKDKGWYAEYKDFLGFQKVHTAAALWTIYHAIDEGVADALQQYQMLRYVDASIPSIPIRYKNWETKNHYTLSTTNWQPYTWSINNVVLTENLHTALSYWQANENDKAFLLWKSNVFESMYASAAPGNFGQLSFYDAARGELYRDFADGVGMAARTLVEGLFGILPNALYNQLHIQPGFPSDWKFAKITTPNILFSFQKNADTSFYTINQFYSKKLSISLQIPAQSIHVQQVLVNNIPVQWNWKKLSIGKPQIVISVGNELNNNIKIVWGKQAAELIKSDKKYIANQTNTIQFSNAYCEKIIDPQEILQQSTNKKQQIQFSVKLKEGNHCFFLQMKQENATWIQPIHCTIEPTISVENVAKDSDNYLLLQYKNNSTKPQLIESKINHHHSKIFQLKPFESITEQYGKADLVFGTNNVEVLSNKQIITTKQFIKWNIPTEQKQYQTVNIAAFFNEKITKIFKHKYESPTATSTTLKIPWQGIGNWCYPLVDPIINDSGLIAKAATTGIFLQDIPFNIPSNQNTNNIAFTSLWQQFPQQITIPIATKAKHAYFLMAGSTNHMQSRFLNGKILITYTDDSTDSLQLINPTNWYPIEQDYYTDGFAFTTDAPKPFRLLLKDGSFTQNITKYTSIKGFSTKAIEGGAATVIDMPLNPNKTVKSISIQTLANEVIIGLMAITFMQ